MTYLLDSGFVYAQYNGKDKLHSRVSDTTLIAQRDIIVPPVPAITEIIYLLKRDLGIDAATLFLESLGETDLKLETPTIADYARAADVLREYNDANIDFVDTCIVAVAERLNITKILTVDRRHFSIFRPNRCDSFEIFPE